MTKQARFELWVWLYLHEHYKGIQPDGCRGSDEQANSLSAHYWLTSGITCTTASDVMMPPLKARSSLGIAESVDLNQSVIKLHMDAAKMTNKPATLRL